MIAIVLENESTTVKLAICHSKCKGYYRLTDYAYPRVCMGLGVHKLSLSLSLSLSLTYTHDSHIHTHT